MEQGGINKSFIEKMLLKPHEFTWPYIKPHKSFFTFLHVKTNLISKILCHIIKIKRTFRFSGITIIT
jgi:hypothetical protein